MKTSIFRYIFALALGVSWLFGDISGVVFRDLPMNGDKYGIYGKKDPETIKKLTVFWEPGVAGVTVKGVDENGKEFSTVTDENGTYTIKGLSGKVRLEFSNWPSYLKESYNGGVENSSVRFINDGDTDVNFGLHNPEDFTFDNNPILITAIYKGGRADGATSGKERSIVRWKYQDYSAESFETLTTKAQTESIWGLAYDKRTKKIYASPVLHRHVGLLDNDNDGYGDIGVIYRLENNVSNPSVEEFYRFKNSEVGFIENDTNRNLPDSLDPSYDVKSFDKIGNIGLGDIDLSPDGKTLYVANIYQHKIYLIDTENKSVISTIDVPRECANPEDARVFALKYEDDRLYFGVTCTAYNSQKDEDLKAIIYQYKDNQITKVLDFPLNYEKGSVWGDIYGKQFKPWVHSWDELYEVKKKRYKIHPQPLLDDIEFVYRKGKKYMVMSFLDRTGLQTGQDNFSTDTNDTKTYDGMAGGDILIAYMNGDGTATLENDGHINGDGGSSNDEGPGGGEFFYKDGYSTHRETSLGGEAYLKGSNDILINVYDPEDYSSGGTRFYNLADGTKNNSKELYETNEPGAFGKAAGMGDIELLTDLAPIEVGDRVWFDEDGDGVQDANESGISGVKVQLVCNGIVKAEANTNSNGYYIFSNDITKTSTQSHKYGVSDLAPQNPNNCMIVIPDIKGSNKQSALGDNNLTVANTGEGSNHNLNDSNGIVDGNNAIATINPEDIGDYGVNNHSFDFGFTNKALTPTYCLGDYIWIDTNYNGIQDSTEKGISGIKITLNETGQTVTTDNNGKYQFCNLENGEYSITVDSNSLPTGYKFTKQNVGNDSSDSDVNISTGVSDKVIIQDANNTTLDVGIYQPTYCLGDYIWEDKNENGIQDVDEKGVEGIRIILNETNASTITDENGRYEFCNLPNGDYSITIDTSTLPDGYKITKQNSTDDSKDSDINPNTGKSDTITIKDANNTTLDGGIYQPTYCLGDWIWEDENKDGIQNSMEDGIANVVVKLFKDGVDTNQTDMSDGNGRYEFCGLVNGNYSIVIDKTTLPKGYGFTKQNAGDDSKDSDIDPNTGESDQVVIKDKDNKYLDVGLIPLPTYCLGDFIWKDSNQNGIQDAEEEGVKGVKVTLNEIGESVFTDENGKYEFCGLVNGDYSITIDTSTLPDGYKITKQNATDDSKDSDINPNTGKSDTITIKDANNTTLDGGIYQPTYCLGDFIWKDSNQNGIQDAEEEGVKGVKVTLNETGESVFTDENGKYEFCGLVNGDYSITIDTSTLPDGYKITKQNATDDSKDSDINPNTGKSDTITIKDANNTTLDGGIYQPSYCLGDFVWEDKNGNGIQDNGEKGLKGIKVIVNETGNFAISDENGNYRICGLVEGNYSIIVDKFSLPKGYLLSPKDMGNDDSKDSDVDPKSGESQTIKIKDANITTLDIGVIPTYCLGDFVWEDKNGNGIQDAEEEGVKGVKVTLNETGESVFTDENGKYEFCGLVNGDYSITIDISTLPDGYKITKQNATDDSKDSDINPNTGKSDTITIKDANNTTLDGGIYQPSYCLGDFIWKDSNQNGIQDAEEEGVKGVKVTLNETGESVLTDENGKYEFCGLVNGDYSITIDTSTLPDGYKITKQNATDDSKDSDINPNTGKSEKVSILNRDNFTLDGGIFKSLKPTVKIVKENPTPKIPKIDIEKHTNGYDADTKDQAVPLVEGDKVIWEYIITNIGTDTLTDIQVIDNKEGVINCPKNTLTPKEKMVCIKESIAKYPIYGSPARVVGKGKDSQRKVTDEDSSWYATKYIIGTHFWIDSNKDGIYQEGKEKPIPNALVELFDANGNKIAQTRTNEKGEYRFLVDAGEYYVRFHLPEEFKKKGFIFDTPKENNDNQININKANEKGITKLVSVGPNADTRHKVENLTLDAGVNCGCDAPGIEQGSGDTFGRVSVILILMLTMLLGLRELEAKGEN